MSGVVAQYPWDEGDHLYASALNAAIANGPYMPSGGAFSLIYFGGKSDGTTDDAEALNEAIATIIALPHGGKIILPAGRTVIGSAIAANIPAGKTLTIEGMGAGASELYYPNATDGLSFNLLNSGNAWGGVHLCGFSLTRGPTSPAAANTGISLSVAASALMYSGTSSLRDLKVQGSSGAALTNQWATSVLLGGAAGITVDNVSILGQNAGATDRGDILMSITGGQGTTFAASINVSNCYLQGGSCGINVSGYVQGVFVVNTTVIGQYDSIRWVSATIYTSEELAVTNCTLNGGHRGFYASYVDMCAVNNTAILHFPSGVAAAWAGIEINHGGFGAISGNTIIGTLVATETGILLSDCGTSPNAVVGNTVGNLMGNAIWMSGTSTENAVAGNCLVTGNPGGVYHGILADTYGNVISGNLWNTKPIYNSPWYVGGDILLSGPTGASHVIFQKAGATNPQRWFVGDTGTAETGGNTGSNFEITSGADDGTIIGPCIAIERSTSIVTIGVPPITLGLANAANDSAAAALGVKVGQEYRNGSVKMVRVA